MRACVQPHGMGLAVLVFLGAISPRQVAGRGAARIPWSSYRAPVQMQSNLLVYQPGIDGRVASAAREPGQHAAYALRVARWRARRRQFIIWEGSGGQYRHPAVRSAHRGTGRLLCSRIDTAGSGALGRRVNRLDPLLMSRSSPERPLSMWRPANRHLRTLLAPCDAVFVIPGNHDARESLRAAFAEDGYLPADGFCSLRQVTRSARRPRHAHPGRGRRLCSRSGSLGSTRARLGAPTRPVLLMITIHPS